MSISHEVFFGPKSKSSMKIFERKIILKPFFFSLEFDPSLCFFSKHVSALSASLWQALVSSILSFHSVPHPRLLSSVNLTGVNGAAGSFNPSPSTWSKWVTTQGSNDNRYIRSQYLERIRCMTFSLLQKKNTYLKAFFIWTLFFALPILSFFFFPW